MPPPQKKLAEALLEGTIPYLESCPGVKDIKVLVKPPCPPSFIAIWERDNKRTLPDDIESFLVVTDGLIVEWTVEFDGESLELGSICLNSVKDIVLVTDPFTYESCERDRNLNPSDIPMDCESPPGAAYLIDECSPYGKVCLCFVNSPKSNNKIEIWFFDNVTRKWSFIASSFSSYFRLLLTHLGIRGWQLAYTSRGWPAATNDWMCFYAPDRASLYRKNRAERKYAVSHNWWSSLQRAEYNGLYTREFSQQQFPYSADRVLKLVQIVSKENSRIQQQAASTNTVNAGSSILNSTRPASAIKKNVSFKQIK